MSSTENTQTFSASRWTKGNRIFPTRISVSPVQVIKTKRSWFSSDEESINIRHISSVRIKNGVILSRAKDLLFDAPTLAQLPKISYPCQAVPDPHPMGRTL